MSHDGTVSSSDTGNPTVEGSEEDSETDEQDLDELMTSQETNSLDDLSSFREQWHQELKSAPEQEPDEQAPNQDPSEEHKDSEDKLTDDEKARCMFFKGVQHERDGKLYDAVRFYRQAVQLVPDIEFRLYEVTKTAGQQTQPAEVNLESLSLEETTCETSRVDEDVEDADEEENMLLRLQRLYMRNSILCQPNQPTNSTHISSLPMEIILYIMKWVVSSEMDLRVLEQSCSAVSRGFYVAARDPEIWKLACVKVWGVHCGSLGNFESWRHMYIQRPHIHFHGCYISKTSYMRAGENSFQDQFYRPWHVVEYYRYIRFFPEGAALMLTTSDDPSVSLKDLKYRQPRNTSVLRGHYRLHDDRVIMVFKRQNDKPKPSNSNTSRTKKRNAAMWSEPYEQTYHLELQIASPRSRLHSQLLWQRYSVVNKRGGTESTTNFDLVGGLFRPFYFSRVKSYTTESENALQ